MAANDRRVFGTSGIPGLGIPPIPDGAISAGDRRHIAGFVTPGGEDVGGGAHNGHMIGAIMAARCRKGYRYHMGRRCRRKW